MKTSEDKTLEDLCLNIRKIIAENPNRLAIIMTYMHAGIQDALDKANKARAGYDIAFRSALGLASKKRLSDETIKALNKTIVNAVNVDCCSKIERNVVEDLIDKD